MAVSFSLKCKTYIPTLETSQPEHQPQKMQNSPHHNIGESPVEEREEQMAGEHTQLQII